jgi:SPP1 gp7 family putative phage head morphogenesis protein
MPEQIDTAYAIGLSPEKAIEYFRSKGYAITFRWSDIWGAAHAKAFTVAKCAQLDVLQDIRGAVDKALAEGQTFRDFQKNITPTLQAKGWWGKKMMVDPLTGEEKPVQLGSPRRLETIYRTNIAVAESAGRYKELMESVDTHPYWQYIAVHDAKTRPSHMALDGKVFRWDDPFWNKFFPPIDWGCRCHVRALTAKQVRERGLKVESSKGTITTSDKLVSRASGELHEMSTYTDPVTGVKTSTGLGWDHNPGQAWQTDALAWQKARDMDESTRTAFLADMAKSKLCAEMFPDWVDGIIQRGEPRGFALTIGWMKPELLKTLAAHKLEPATPFIVADDKGILHMSRDAKKGIKVKKC